MDILEMKKAADELARKNGMRWYDHIMRRPEEDVLMKAIVHEMDEKCQQDQLRMKWRNKSKETWIVVGGEKV